MHYAQLELDRIYSNKRPLHVQQQEKMDPVLVLENAYHLTSLDAQNEVGHHFHGKETKGVMRGGGRNLPRMYGTIKTLKYIHAYIEHCRINNSLYCYALSR